MKIKYMTEDDLNTVKKNLPSILQQVIVEKNKTLSDLLENDNILRDTSFNYEEFQLDMSQPRGKESLTDIENVQRVYNHMKFLSDSQASDERIWAAYTFVEYLDYMRYRWPATKTEDLNNRYLFGYTMQRSLFRNGIARLWWIGRFTYDEKRNDPYELTKFLCKEQDYIESICGRNIFNNPEIGLATISALYDAEKAGIKIDRYVVRDIGKYVNLLAGTYLLDTFTKEEVYEKIKKKLNF